MLLLVVGGGRKMNDYKKLKIGKYGIPTWDAFTPIVVEVLMENGRMKRQDIIQKVIEKVSLPTELTRITYPESDVLIAADRISWVFFDATKAGILMRPSRGVYEVTSLGKELLDEYGYELNRSVIHSQQGYKDYLDNVSNKKEGTLSTPVESDDASPVDKVGELISKMKSEVAEELLNKILESEPAFFERLVVKLLIAMGYQGDNGSSQITPFTNDGGIDGIINQDPLGTQTVYIQAKRYSKGNNVQKPAIKEFYGAIKLQDASRGVFITTSDFSAGAREVVKNSDGVVLINGDQLTNLMLKYHVGVEVINTYELFKIDEDFFEY